MAQGVSCLLGVALSDRRGQGLVLRLLREPAVSQRGARDQKAPFGSGLLGERAREAPAGVRESKQQGWLVRELALCFVQLSQKRLMIGSFTYKFNPQNLMMEKKPARD
jgi:hypothetical protein